MIKTTAVMTVGTFVDDLQNGGIDFDYPIQRNGGQWNDEKASLLMHSFMDDYPVPPVYALVNTIQVTDEDGEEVPHEIYSILDGKQRLTRIQDFINNSLQLSENTPPVTITKGQKRKSVEVGGLYFDTLPKEVKEKFLKAELSMVKISSATDEEIENVFFRLNNGEALTKTQQGKSVMGEAWAKRLTSIAKHNAMTINAQFTPLQKKKADDEMTVIQTMMIMDSIENGFDLKSISSNHAFEYIGRFKKDEEILLPLYNKVVEGLDYIHEAFENNLEKFLLKKVHMTAAILTALHAKEQGIAPIRYKDWTVEFEKSYRATKKDHIKTNYRDFALQGTVAGFKAKGRVSEMIKHFDTYMSLPQKEELNDAVAKLKEKVDGKAPVENEEDVVQVTLDDVMDNENTETTENVEVTVEEETTENVEVTVEEETTENVEVTETVKDEKKKEDEVEISLDGILG